MQCPTDTNIPFPHAGFTTGRSRWTGAKGCSFLFQGGNLPLLNTGVFDR